MNLKQKVPPTPLGRYLKEIAETRRLSLRAIAAEAEISHSYLSEIINGKKVPEAGVCNAIADFFDVPRVKILSLAGWLDLSEDELLIESFRERVEKDREFAEFIKILLYEENAVWRRCIMKMMRAVIEYDA